MMTGQMKRHPLRLMILVPLVLVWSCSDEPASPDDLQVSLDSAAADLGTDLQAPDARPPDLLVPDMSPPDLPPPTCTDNKQNGAETDVDCGGAACPKCADSKKCAAATDCTSGVCTGGVCVAPSCMDKIKNGAETDVDCGGAACPKCAKKSACALDSDCLSGVCKAGTCQEATCTDAVKNGAETDVDCGGACAACADGKTCGVAADCASGVCAGGACATPSCTDAVKNGAETDVDCGGACAACADGKTCGVAADCASGVCAGGACAAPSCTDKIKNGAETDVDCGGACGACGVGKKCATNKDCQPFFCGSGNTCAAGTSCAAILAMDKTAKSGTYTIQPGPAVSPFQVYCDMTGHHGGWILVAKLGAGTPTSAKGDLTKDRDTSALLSATASAGSQFATWNLSRFDAFKSGWTIRVSVDTANNGVHHQYTFFRPAAAAVVSPGTAGTNWLGTTTATKLLHLVASNTTGLSNTTWLPVNKWDNCCGVSSMILGYRLNSHSGGGGCLSSAGQTQYCHAPAGGLIVSTTSSHVATWTAAFNHGDAVTHAHGRRATYWIKDVNQAGTP